MRRICFARFSSLMSKLSKSYCSDACRICGRAGGCSPTSAQYGKSPPKVIAINWSLRRQPEGRSTPTISLPSTNPSGLDVANANQTVTVRPSAHDVGYFTLQYAYDQTSPIPFGADPSVVDDLIANRR